MSETTQPTMSVLQPAVERRTARMFDVKVREAGQGKDETTITLTGYAAVFDSASLPLYDWMYGEFTERIAPGAFTRALAAGRNVHLAYSHDMASVMASTESGTLQLFQDEKGLRVVAELDPADVDVQRVAPKMRAGIVREMSFAFTVERDQWIVEELGDGTERVERVILEIAELFEASVVPQGAYPATEAGVRAKEARSRIEAASEAGRIPQRERVTVTVTTKDPVAEESPAAAEETSKEQDETKAVETEDQPSDDERSDGTAQPSGEEPRSAGDAQPVGEVARNREAEAMRMQVAVHLAISQGEHSDGQAD